MPLFLMTSIAMFLVVLGADGTVAVKDERSNQILLGPI